MKRRSHDRLTGSWIAEQNRISQQSVFGASLAALGALSTVIFTSGIAFGIEWFDDKQFMALALPMSLIGLSFAVTRTILDPYTTSQYGYLEPFPQKNLASDHPKTPDELLSLGDRAQSGLQHELTRHQGIQRTFGRIQWGSYGATIVALGLFFAFGLS